MPDGTRSAPWVDAHSHLSGYEGSLGEALAQVDALGILTLAVSMDPESFEVTRRLAAASPYIVPAFGVHPWRAASFSGDRADLVGLVRQSAIVGEIGLDYHWQRDEKSYPRQREIFECLMAAAAGEGKSVNLHTKGAEEEVLEALRRHRPPNPIVHWYSGPLELVDGYLELGCYFTVCVDLQHADTAPELLRHLPKDRLLTETDNPGGYRWLVGEDGMPDLIGSVACDVGRILDMSPDEVREVVAQNFARAVSHSKELVAVCRRLGL